MPRYFHKQRVQFTGGTCQLAAPDKKQSRAVAAETTGPLFEGF